ncbi:glutaredoxin [Striga asiatica]|uniref:Glutaredoxin n=1 Tax=Striga asiatica TaxID=4170 RepID=A0A5A7NY21_STRAF|nr:glutaredoxin [Striga asiatica]
MAVPGGGSVKEVKSMAELDNTVGEGVPVILHFWASWCDASKHMDQVFSHLSTDFPLARFLRVHFLLTSVPYSMYIAISSTCTALYPSDSEIETIPSIFVRGYRKMCYPEVEAEEQPEISEKYSVSAVPFFVFFKNGKMVDTLEGANPSSLANKVAKVAGSIKPGEPAAPASLGMAAGPTVLETVQHLAQENSASQKTIQTASPSADNNNNNNALTDRLHKLVTSQPVMLFMKGSPTAPKCGFSQKVVDILKKENIPFGSFDILTDNEVREGLKKFSNWPTFPQLYCNGDLLGGCDIVIAMQQNGELRDIFRDQGIQENNSGGPKPESGKGGISEPSGLSAALRARLSKLINSAPVVLFMKGKADEPRCGFSRKVVDILRQEKVEFESFDILSDDEVRQGLKVYSNWSSYPQLYIKGELVGGSDIVLEMQKSGELRKVLGEKGIPFGETLEDRLRKLVNSSEVMLFMKGSPDEPRCGFSSKVVGALKEEGVEFGSFDILGDEEVRQGLKSYSNWPTFPQLYYKGELVGGCDIVMELRGSGELKSTLSE